MPRNALLSDSAKYLVGRGISSALAFAAIAIYTHLLSTAEYGYYALTVSAVGLANTVMYQWLRFGLTRFRMVHAVEEQKFLSTVLGAFGITTGLAILIGGFTGFVSSSYAWHRLVWVAQFLLLGQAWFELNLELARARFQATRYGILSALRGLLALVGGVFLIEAGLREYGPLVAIAIASPLAAAAVMWKAWRGMNFHRIDATLAKQLLAYGYPLIATAFLAFVINSTDRFMIAGMLGPAQAGEYAPSYDLAQQSLGMLMFAIYLGGFPQIARCFEQNKEVHTRELVDDYGALLMAVGVPAAIGVVMLAHNIAGCFLGKNFVSAATAIMPVIALGTLLSGLKTYYLDITFQLSRHTIYLIWTTAFAAVANVVLNLVWIRQFGIVGAAYATVVSFMLSSVASIIVGRQLYQIPILTLDLGKVVLAGLLMAICLWPIRQFVGIENLVLQVVMGGLSYSLGVMILNVHGYRTQALHALKAVVSRMRQ